MEDSGDKVKEKLDFLKLEQQNGEGEGQILLRGLSDAQKL
jgi:hypothetical protein